MAVTVAAFAVINRMQALAETVAAFAVINRMQALAETVAAFAVITGCKPWQKRLQPSQL
jgi:hypothetical protein